MKVYREHLIKSLNTLGIVLINIFLFIVGNAVYLIYSEEVINTTAFFKPSITIAFIVLYIIGFSLVVGIENKYVRRFGVGGVFLLVPTLILLFFVINSLLAFTGEYENFELKEAKNVKKNNYLMQVEFSENIIDLSVPPHHCFQVDSVQVWIKKGLFGMERITEDLRIVERVDCQKLQPVDSKDFEGNLDAGVYFLKRRCFSKAEEFYSDCVKLDSVKWDCYYQRGVLYLMKEKYQSALSDFKYAAIARYNALDRSLPYQNSDTLKAYYKRLVDSILENNVSDIADASRKLALLDDFDNYQFYINYCIEKIGQEE